MRQEQDFEDIDPLFFTTSQAGQNGPDVGSGSAPLEDAMELSRLALMDVILTCQGGSYTEKIHAALRAAGWEGYWIDAASTLRMEPSACIILDPVNQPVIDRALSAGVKDFIGGNCTVSLMLMGIEGLFRQGWIEWISSMTYQSASGAGAANMKELVAQMADLAGAGAELALDPASAVLELDRHITERIRKSDFPTHAFGAPLAGSLIPWIDRAVGEGQTREEWKGEAETNKILGCQPHIPVDGLCVRVGAMRCHSQGLTIKLRRDVPLNEIEDAIASANEWTRVVPNDKTSTLASLTPAAVNGALEIPVGRLRKMRMGPDYLAAFTVGDQLLWGAAEPVRRMLRILVER
jgi:aspartate-semialdehyde dehydrogenase